MKYLILIFFFLSSATFAQKSKCELTPEILTDVSHEPLEFHKNANLTNISREEPEQSDHKILIKGIVKDENCVPIYDAKIEIWQADRNGEFNYANIIGSEFKSSNFAGSGTDYSDNNGSFAFITEFPGKINKLPPQINIRIKHPEFKEFETKIYFPGEDNKKDKVFANNKNANLLVANEKDFTTKDFDKVFTINFILKGKNFYRTY